MSLRDENDGVLVARARAGDPRAFDTLVRRHYGAAFAVALAVLSHRADAEDACQDAFVRALERLEECRDPGRFLFWLLQIARNQARNLLDRRRVRSAEPLDSVQAAGPEDPGRDLARDRMRIRLEEALSRIPEAPRTVVLLHDLEGWRHREIAEHLEISEVMSRQHLFQARRRLREILREEETDGTSP